MFRSLAEASVLSHRGTVAVRGKDSMRSAGSVIIGPAPRDDVYGVLRDAMQIRAVTVAAIVFLASATDISGQSPIEARPTIMLTGQLVGFEVEEGVQESGGVRVFLSGECWEESDQHWLRCNFNSAAITRAGTACDLLASAWAERFHLVRRSATEVVWTATRGPEGLSGMVQVSTLTVHPSKLLPNRRLDKSTPAAVDEWEYESRTIPSVPRSALTNTTLKPVTLKAVSTTVYVQSRTIEPAECRPDQFTVIPAPKE